MEKALLFETPKEISLEIAAKEKRLRKSKGITQARLSEETGIPLPTLRYFEQKGEISFVSLIKICLALDCIEEIKAMFSKISYQSIEEVIKNAKQPR